MSIWNNINEMNPFAKFFIRNKEHSDVTRDHFSDKNAQGISNQEYEKYMMSAGSGGVSGYDQQYVDFNPTLETKKARVQTYREMALSPEIDDGITNIANDCIQVDPSTGMIFDLEFIERSDKEIPDVVKQRIRNAYEYLYYEVLNFNDTAYDLFKRFLVDSELYIEWVLNDKGTNIIDWQALPSFTMVPIWSERGSRVKGFVQLLKDVVNYSGKYNLKEREDAKVFQSNQISYIAYPGPRGSNRLDVRGYLETAIRIWNLLRAVEDAIVVYRLVRAPERRVWNIYTAGLPPQKASEYINGLQRKYKKKLVYDSTTGTIDQTQNVQSVLEDFWFPKDSTGVTSTVDVLQSGMNLGEITDLDYLQKKLYKALKLPSSRWADPASQYTGGKIGEVTREEVRFYKFTSNINMIFKKILLEPLFLLCKMRGIDEKYISHALINIKPTVVNHFEEFLQNDIINTKLSILQTVGDKIWSPENPTGFHWDIILKDLCNLPQSLIDKNNAAIEAAIKEAADKVTPEEAPAPAPDESGMGGPMDMGGAEMPEELPPEADASAVEAEAAKEPEATPEGMGMTAGAQEDLETA